MCKRLTWKNDETLLLLLLLPFSIHHQQHESKGTRKNIINGYTITFFLRAKMQWTRQRKFFWGLSSLQREKFSFILFSKWKRSFFMCTWALFFFFCFRLCCAIRREECKMCSRKTIKIYQAPHEERAIKIIFLDTTLFHQRRLKMLKMGCLKLPDAVSRLMEANFFPFHFEVLVRGRS